MDLREAIATLPPPATLEGLQALVAALEARTLRAALEASGWLPERAARLLGKRSGSSLQRALARHPELAAEVARRRRGENGPTHPDA